MKTHLARHTIVLLLASIAVAACASATSSPISTPTAAVTLSPTSIPTVTAIPEAEAARQALLGFLGALNEGRFDAALPTYAGPYDGIQVFDTSIPAEDHLGLLRNACQSGNLRCYAPIDATLESATGPTEWTFWVEFSNPDGTLFVRGPCCGASPTEMPPESKFVFRVVKANDGQFSVLDLPPYVP